MYWNGSAIKTWSLWVWYFTHCKHHLQQIQADTDTVRQCEIRWFFKLNVEILTSGRTMELFFCDWFPVLLVSCMHMRMHIHYFSVLSGFLTFVTNFSWLIAVTYCESSQASTQMLAERLLQTWIRDGTFWSILCIYWRANRKWGERDGNATKVHQPDSNSGHCEYIACTLNS